MCGIAGWFNASVRRPSALLLDMCKHIKNRGPDATGARVFAAGVPSDAGEIGLGHTRLSIIDLSERALQPMADATGRYWIVFNGEIYNFESVRETLLGRHRIDFKSRSDTEVLLYAYIHMGEKCLDLFDGMFAFAVVDLVKKELFLARDRVGVKPLYYCSKNGEFVFSSVLKPIVTYFGNGFSINDAAMEEFFVRGYIGGEATIAEGVLRLTPGHWMRVFADGRVEKKCWWRIEQEKIPAPDFPCDEAAVLRTLGDTLSAAVRLRLISDVPLGVFLSGGIDSALVASLAAKESKEQISTFTIGFTDPRFDESESAAAIAAHLGTRHRRLVIGEKDFMDVLGYFSDAFDEPFADESAIPTLLLSRFARENITVALSGDGGDEQYFGYTRYDHLRKLKRLYGLPRWLRQLPGALLPRGLFNFDTLVKLQSLRYRSFLDCRQNLANPLPAVPFALDRGNGGVIAGVKTGRVPEETEWMLWDFLGYMPDDVLVKVDRASMRFGLEVRNPLLDHGFVEHSYYTVPQALKTSHGKKYLLKKMLGRHVPEALFDRPKKGFDIPLRHWVNHALHDEIASRLERPSGLERLFAMGAVKKLFHDQKFLGTKYGSFLFWRIYVFLKWEENFAGRAP
ncbi:MAG TPA: asparagine synthase (glutamine-hydrolyzing) [Chitinivibrionales bacterium]|nr:asparagine synthase (glutamine-hydrolyzing) [Chitinivibrionales bacterium]